MGENSAAADPIPLLASPLKGEELGREAQADGDSSSISS
jgi:hypothetical protein